MYPTGRLSYSENRMRLRRYDERKGLPFRQVSKFLGGYAYARRHSLQKVYNALRKGSALPLILATSRKNERGFASQNAGNASPLQQLNH